MASNNTELRASIQTALVKFRDKPLGDASNCLLGALGYSSDKVAEFASEPTEFIKDIEEATSASAPIQRDKILLDKWKECAFLFQLTNDEIPSLAIGQQSLVADNIVQREQMESFVYLAIELQGEDWSRTDLATITRELNKRFPMPAIVLFKHGTLVSLTVIDRRINRRDSSKDVIDGRRISIIKDIRCCKPHSAHLHILSGLAIENLGEKHCPTNFRELYEAWIKALSIQALNEKFYKELFYWYLYAVKTVQFPRGGGEVEAKRNSVAVIRLLTRLIFVWFIKEKGLVPDELFERDKLGTLLKSDPTSHPDDNTYYLAVLQNLFFATLNVEMGTDEQGRPWRRWSEKSKTGGQSGHYLIHSVYRYKEEFKDPDAALQLYGTIPFLNGGLFECLDRELTDLDFQRNPDLKKLAVKEGNGWVLRIDGFSRRSEAQPTVPNKLFFGGEPKADLNEDLKTSGKNYEVHGLIDIFNQYKFTVDENTPVEEEVALDPELLGKVFENLLASYNEDTKTTARKLTGSFYTPREVVDYMVDEALVAYFERQLNPKATDESLAPRLRQLLSYADEEFDLSDDEKVKLIAAIERLTILDPACGSGAFPMGALAKLVHLLKKLDKDNVLWRSQNRVPLEGQLREAGKIPDPNMREDKIEEAEAALAKFDRDFSDANYPDYTRKLYLIEKCIHGVDIQPIAVQIAKLRFFISLIVSQKVDNKKENRNITALPNLETKIVAADSLTPIDRPEQMGLRDFAIDDKEKELATANEHYFAARTGKTKRKWRDRIFTLRDELATLLEKDRFLSKGAARQLVHWDPFNQNAAAEFFDPEWMFQLSKGFHVIIGNPPYRQVKKGIYSEKFFPYAEGKDKGKQNLYKLFVELALNLCSNQGIVSLIVQSSLMCDLSAAATRDNLLTNANLLQLLEFPKIAPNNDAQVFEGVLQGTCVVVFVKTNTDNNTDFLLSIDNDASTVSNPKFAKINAKFIKATYPGLLYFPLVTQSDLHVLSRIEGKYSRLESLVDSSKSGQGDLNLSNEKKSFGPNKTSVSLYRGKHVHKYWLDTEADEFVMDNFRVDLQNFNKTNKYIVVQEITGTTDRFRIHACIPELNQRYLFGHTTNKLVLRNQNSTYFVLSLLNSAFHDWFFRLSSTNNHVNGYELALLPIPVCDQSQHDILGFLSRLISRAQMISQGNSLIAPRYEQLINGLVYELFFSEDLHKSNIHLFTEAEKAGIGMLASFEGEELVTAASKLAEKIFNTNHPIYGMLFDLQGLDVVRIIEGRE